ncbi:MAG: hypothetical protein WBN66_05975 [Smithella sp.]
MKKTIILVFVFIGLAVMTCLMPLKTYAACADEQELFTEGSSYPPNVLIILDNSQSMDEDLDGNLVGPWKTGSRLVEAKQAMQDIVNKYKNTMNIGLMAYKLNSVSDYKMHNTVYFASYDPKSYCHTNDKTLLAACQDYCKTGNETSRIACESGCQAVNGSFDETYRDEILSKYDVGTEQRNRYCQLVYPKTQTNKMYYDATNYTSVYYKLPGTYYTSSNKGNKFLYSRYYDSSEGGSDDYRAFPQKTGTDDGTYVSPNPGSYSGTSSDYSFFATDEDIALGYKDYGRRMAWYYVGRTWYASSSPGVGFLHQICATGSNSQVTALNAKLALKENDETGYMSSSCGGSSANSCAYIINAGLTPIAGTLQSAINYFEGDLSKDESYTGKTPLSPIASNCQKNYVILVSDGLPSVSETGTKNSAENLMPKVIEKIDKLRKLDKAITVGSTTTTYTFNILTFVVGMALTDEAKPHLDNMAVHGGTADVDGHAVYADDATSIYTALDNIMTNITARTYSFSTSSISSSRTADENYLYEATFIPTSSTPFWRGQLKKWSLGTDGSMSATVWDAGEVLKNRDPATRNIKTMIGGSLVDFKSSDIAGSTPVPYQYLKYATDVPLIVTNQTTANKVIKYIRGYQIDPADSTALKPTPYKLGDIFHSSPITLATPSLLWSDMLDSTNAFADHRAAHQRDSATGTRSVITGANDGQFHAFNTATGQEYWSFIPPNLLPKLQDIYHITETSTLEHQFFVDGSITAMETWLPSTWDDGDPKSASDWKTLVMFALGRNDCDYSATSKATVRQSTKYWGATGTACSSLNTAGTALDIKETYDTSHLDYCGYWAFDFTDAPGTAPSFKWVLNPGITLAPYLGEPWGGVSPGRVKINGIETWVGVIGGGYNGATAPGDLRGKGIIVFDLRNGTPIWSYTYADTTDMEYAIPSKVSVVDSDNDGYLDRGYVGDVKGNVWQIKFCTKKDYISDANCDTSDWEGGLLFDKASGSDKYPFYHAPTIVWDRAGDLWMYGASGDTTDPNGMAPASWVYGIKPLKCVNSTTGDPSPCLRNDLSSITSSSNTYCDEDVKPAGWTMNLAGASEKVLAAPWAFNNVLYFTSFFPKGSSDATCTKTGTSSLYAISIETGTSSLDCTAGQGLIDGSGGRSTTIGAGIASGGAISYGPGASTPNIFVTVSGAGGQEGGTIMSDFVPPSPATRTNLIYWKDKRLE